MNENNNRQQEPASNHVEFVTTSNDKTQDKPFNEIHFYTDEVPTKIMHRTISNPIIYEPNMNSDFTNSDTEEEEKNINLSNQGIKAVSSDAQCYISMHTDKVQSNGHHNEKLKFPNSVYKRYSSASIPINMKNKLTLQKYQQLASSLDQGKFHNNQFQKVSFYGKKLQVGLGFPSKIPIFIENTDLIERSEKKYDNLENIIQKLKSEDKSLSVIVNNGDDQKDLENDEINCPISKSDIFYINNDINKTKKEFIEMETDLISDLSVIKSSISKILEERKEIQKQHKIWLSNMKKKIYKTKEKTKNINNNNFVSICVK